MQHKQDDGAPLPRSGYLDWAATLAGIDARGRSSRPQRLAAQSLAFTSERFSDQLWEPVFVRVKDPALTPDVFFRHATAEMKENTGIAFDPFEQIFNEVFFQSGQPIETILYRRYDRRSAPRPFDDLYDVLAVGGLVTEVGLPQTTTTKPLNASPFPVVLGVIDDGIAVFHPRTRRDMTHTRFLAFWSQTLGTVSSTGVASGLVESAADIDASLAQLSHTTEEALYRQRAAMLYDPATRQSILRVSTHGALMLDLAGGEDPGGPLSNVPLLGVQLPPQAFDDTSGQRLQIPLIQAIRWMIFQTFAYDLARDLVINASLGTVAGPKDGSSFVEQQIAREIARAQTYTGRPDCIALTLPYGNAYADRLVSRHMLHSGETTEVLLRVQHDDRTPSYLEMRPTAGQTGRDPGVLEIALAAPGGFGAAGPQTIAVGAPLDLPNPDGDVVARVFHQPANPALTVPEPAFLLAAFAPTARTFDGDLICPSGIWRLSIKNTGTDCMELIVTAQRDDSPFPRQTGARQSYLESLESHDWNAKTRNYDGLGAGSITHSGTNSAYSTVNADAVLTVGGAQTGATGRQSARYAAQGADWSGAHPDLAAISDNAPAMTGVRGSGTYASSTGRLAGTSTASATVARSLILEKLGMAPLPSVPVGPEDARLGDRIITGNPAFRSR